MLSSVVVVALAALAHAAPLEERAITITEVTDVYTTVFEDAPAATEAPTTPTHQWWKWKGKGKPKPTTTAVYVTPTPEPAAEAPAATVEVPSPSYAAPAATQTAASSGGYTGSNDYSKSVVDHHNAHRANHSAPALEWDDAIAATALKIAKSCNYAHDVSTDGGGYGQNIAAGCPADNVTSIITELFYNNEAGNFNGMYGQSTPSNIQDESAFDGWGHFTQIVWKGTTKVGCATYDCSNDGGLKGVGGSVAPIFTVCNYKSAGNFLGEFDSNVGQPLGHAQIHWNTLQ
jgi:uncharacterized protein YkwD